MLLWTFANEKCIFMSSVTILQPFLHFFANNFKTVAFFENFFSIRWISSAYVWDKYLHRFHKKDETSTHQMTRAAARVAWTVRDERVPAPCSRRQATRGLQAVLVYSLLDFFSILWISSAYVWDKYLHRFHKKDETSTHQMTRAAARVAWTVRDERVPAPCCRRRATRGLQAVAPPHLNL